MNNEPLNQILRYCIVLVGIKKDYVPSEAQFAVLVGFLKLEQGGFTPSEIKHAFHLAVGGRLNVSVQSYQSFDSVYVSDVLKAYKDYVTKKGYHMKLHQEESIEKTEAEKLAILNEDALRLGEMYSEAKKSQQERIKDPYGVNYNHLLRLGFINPTIEEKKQSFEQAKKGIGCEKVTDTNERNTYQEFKNGGCKKNNKYYVKCVIKSKALISEKFISDCLKFGVDLEKEIRESLKM